jgi:hypothetical protein
VKKEEEEKNLHPKSRTDLETHPRCRNRGRPELKNRKWNYVFAGHVLKPMAQELCSLWQDKLGCLSLPISLPTLNSLLTKL